MRFKTSKTDNAISLSQYVQRFTESQKEIYFISGDDYKQLKLNPLIAKLVKKDIEVLFFDKPIDEFAFQDITK